MRRAVWIVVLLLSTLDPASCQSTAEATAEAVASNVDVLSAITGSIGPVSITSPVGLIILAAVGVIAAIGALAAVITVIFMGMCKCCIGKCWSDVTTLSFAPKEDRDQGGSSPPPVTQPQIVFVQQPTPIQPAANTQPSGAPPAGPSNQAFIKARAAAPGLFARVGFTPIPQTPRRPEFKV